MISYEYLVVPFIGKIKSGLFSVQDAGYVSKYNVPQKLDSMLR